MECFRADTKSKKKKLEGFKNSTNSYNVEQINFRRSIFIYFF